MRTILAVACGLGVAGAALVVACGGSDGSGDLIGPAPDGSADATLTPTGSEGGGGGGGDGGGAGGDGGGSGDGGARGPDGSVVADGGAGPDSGKPGGDTAQLACGSTSCNIPGESCCVDRVSNVVFQYTCVAGASCPVVGGGGGGGGDPGTALKCSAAANCPAGTKCCIQQNGGVTSSSCKATCGGNEAQLCDPGAATTGCSAAAPCSSNNIKDWGLPGSFATCGGVGN